MSRMAAGPDARHAEGIEADLGPPTSRLSRRTALKIVLSSAVVAALGFAALGSWLASKIEETVKLDVGQRAALYMDTAMSEHLQALAVAPDLSPQASAGLSDTLRKAVRRLDVLEARVWSLDGRVLFADPPASIGRRYELTEDLRHARAGRIAVDFDRHPHVSIDGATPASFNADRLEIYAPIYGETTGEVLAVAEFYQSGRDVIGAVGAARREVWIVTGLACAAVITGIALMTFLGTRLIERQRAALDHQVESLVLLLGQNEELRARIATATQRSTEDHEAVLRRIGSDLHDGVGQLIAIAILRLQKLFGGTQGEAAEYGAVKALLSDCMSEIRHLAAGLALPEIKSLGLADAIRSVVSRHEYRTGTTVNLSIGAVPAEPGHAVRLGICRMLQEGLNNAFKHADGVGQSVNVVCGPERISVAISDKGPGLRGRSGAEQREALGLVVLRNRLESLGATLTIRSEPSAGTTLLADFPLRMERLDLE